ncbi:MAG: hypothetical protein WAN86_28100 [Hyphomicrobiaceae bacterium]
MLKVGFTERFGVTRSVVSGYSIKCTSPFEGLECSGPRLPHKYNSRARFSLLTQTSGLSNYQEIEVYYSKTPDKISWGAVAKDALATAKGPRKSNTPTRLDYFHEDIRHALGDILKELGFTLAMVQAREGHNATRVDNEGTIYHPLLKLKEDGGKTYNCDNYAGGRGYPGFIGLHVSEDIEELNHRPNPYSAVKK